MLYKGDSPMSVQELLSKKEKIKKLSDEAVKDIYTRYHFLNSIQKQRHKTNRTPLGQDSILFKQVNLGDEGNILYKAFRHELETKIFMDLKRRNESMEMAYFDYVTKDDLTDEKKIKIAREKLISASKCSGVPKAVLVHDCVKSYADLEDVN